MSVSAAVGRSPFRARLSTRGTGVPWLVLVLLFVATCSWGLSDSAVSAEASGASVPDEVSVADRNGDVMVFSMYVCMCPCKHACMHACVLICSTH